MTPTEATLARMGASIDALLAEAQDPATTAVRRERIEQAVAMRRKISSRLLRLELENE